MWSGNLLQLIAVFPRKAQGPHTYLPNLFCSMVTAMHFLIKVITRNHTHYTIMLDHAAFTAMNINILKLDVIFGALGKHAVTVTFILHMKSNSFYG